MLFQTLDDKKECIGIYANSQIQNSIPPGVTKTWAYAEYLEDLQIEYANLYCGGKPISQVVPEHLNQEWQEVSAKMKAFFKAFTTAKIDLKLLCFYDMVPRDVLLEWCDLKSKICTHVFENYKKPANYDFLVDLTKLTEKIKYQQVNIDLSALSSPLESYRSRSFIKKIKTISPFIEYDIFGSVTGRLSTKPNSFPIMTMDKKYRKIVKPHNDWFVELDFNAAELRTFIALNKRDQPQEDLHEWNIKNIFRGFGTREEAKTRLFAWLYNPKSEDYLLNREYDRDAIINEYFDGTHVSTPYDRKIRAVPKNALNYLIQSTSSDLFLRQVIKINKLLQDRGSFISWTLHDSVMIDLKDEDKPILKEIIAQFGDTDFGKYLVNVSAGKNFGDLKKIK
jgi:hypothetical protein